MMADDSPNGTRKTQEGKLALFLAQETGITVDQACDLIAMIGTDRPTLLREARILKNRSGWPLS